MQENYHHSKLLYEMFQRKSKYKTMLKLIIVKINY